MAALPEAVRLTYEDSLCFPEDGRRHEVVNGEHVMTPAPNLRHQDVLGNLYWALKSHLRTEGTGRLLLAPCDVVLSDFDVVQPDLLFVAREHEAILTETHVEGAPDLVVEILSESTRKNDLVVKRKLYGRFGVREYWVIDPVVEAVAVYRLEAGELHKESELTAEAGDHLRTPLLPGLEVPLDSLFP